MQTLELTDEQYAVVQQLREEISEQVVGKYGYVRERDAIQFLIDNLDGNPEIDVDIDTELDSSATDDVAASVGAAIEGESPPADLEEVSYIEDESVEDEEPEIDADADAAVVDPDAETDGDDASDADDDAAGPIEDAEADADEGEDDDGGESDGTADDDDMLDEMMSLLETHDDKWEESSSADYRYSVELPDGTTEEVQTKDDVRALLFKNYR
ncbi:hypothetical protein [Haloterrigena alkaliphila]|uniref:Uncharacterized protein n=1 Tax=Haloterrigena alkaliphila TaxID=2816475 RepID=A0A8A2V9H2_9EURY|nr:hypothetical protein [Haloterrigena alkaliphila]QSW98593.1 hypothetical protein J0X25_14510 [Haloterrigena alkaliphila]